MNLAKLEEKAALALQKAKVRLVIGGNNKSIGNAPVLCFFGSLIMQLEYEADWTIPTAEVDGVHMFYNPSWIAGLTEAEVTGVLAHEAMHCTNKHFARLGSRDPLLFNIGCDLAINFIIKDAGFSLPSCGAFPGIGQFSDMPPGLCAEEYYALLANPNRPKPQVQQGDGDGQGNDPGKCGGIRKPTKDGKPVDGFEAKQLERRWDQNLAAAAQLAKRRGTLPGSIARHCESLLAPVHNWREELRQFVTAVAKERHDWNRPNRRYVHDGLYLPSRFSRTIDHAVVIIDTSVSITPETLRRFASEINDIASQGVIKLTAMYHHSDLYLTEEFTDGNPFTVGQCVSGGTSHRWLESALSKCDPQPTVVVALTDLESDFGKEPDCPVLWASTNPRREGPWGSTIYIPEE